MIEDLLKRHLVSRIFLNRESGEHILNKAEEVTNGLVSCLMDLQFKLNTIELKKISLAECPFNMFNHCKHLINVNNGVDQNFKINRLVGDDLIVEGLEHSAVLEFFGEVHDDLIVVDIFVDLEPFRHLCLYLLLTKLANVSSIASQS